MSWFGRWFFQGLLMRIIFHRLLTIRTPMGRKARPKMMHKATPLIRVKLSELLRAGVKRAAGRQRRDRVSAQPDARRASRVRRGRRSRLTAAG